MTKSLVLDVETTTYEKGNAFSQRNKLCYYGALQQGKTLVLGDASIGTDVRRLIEAADECIGFNFKFDLHWLRREGVVDSVRRVWDCQVAHFLLTGQREVFPSLDEVCIHYGIEGKLPDIKEKYWSKGIDTPDIPPAEMLAYLEQDLRATWAVYLKQKKEFESRPKLYNLFRLNMQDLLVLEEMEWNGLKFNIDKSIVEANKIKERLSEIEGHLCKRYPNTPINWDSGDHVSAYLYGGIISIDRKEPVGLFKTGAKVGEVRYRHVEDRHVLTRLVEPLEGSELKKADKDKGTGPWAISDEVLKQVKQIEEVKLLLERAKLTKLLDYFSGWPDLISQKDWTHGMLHGQFNQVRARTGRLSSSAPNLQNMPDPVLQLIESRFSQAQGATACA